MYKYILHESDKNLIEKEMQKIREATAQIAEILKPINGMDIESIGFLRYLATISDLAEPIPHLHLLGDTTIEGFYETCEIVNWEMGTYEMAYGLGQTCHGLDVKFDRKSGLVELTLPQNFPSRPDVTCIVISPANDPDEEIHVCPNCMSYIMKKIMVPDRTGKGLHEEFECPDC